jgi:hypothetical protein
MAVGQLVDDTYELNVPEPVGKVTSLLSRLHQHTKRNGPIIVGFDFPIGVPSSYARHAGIDHFIDVLSQFGTGRWGSFYEIAGRPNEISVYRPFYPFRPGGASQGHLTKALGVTNIRELLRTCELGNTTRHNACALFWTLGAQQVGRGAIVGWRDVIAPALRDSSQGVAVWPFHGGLDDLLENRQYVIVETYPAEACLHVGLTPPGTRWGKRHPMDRQSMGKALLTCGKRSSVFFRKKLEEAVLDGFGPGESGEDPFDAVLGLISMIEVILGHRTEGAPTAPAIRDVEGWIFGMTKHSLKRHSPDMETRTNACSTL